MPEPHALHSDLAFARVSSVAASHTDQTQNLIDENKRKPFSLLD